MTDATEVRKLVEELNDAAFSMSVPHASVLPEDAALVRAAAAALVALLEANERLRDDKERLDWLSEQKGLVEIQAPPWPVFDDDGVEHNCEDWGINVLDGEGVGTGTTLREAIDEAIEVDALTPEAVQ